MISKKGFELSINFLVILILTVATFGGGLILARKMFSSAGDIKDKISDQQEKQIQEMMLNGDELVVLPVNKKTLSMNSHGVVGLGINNVLKSNGISKSNTFRVGVKLSTVQFKDQAGTSCFNSATRAWTQSESCGMNPNNFIKMIATDYPVNVNDQYVVEIPLIIPKTGYRGTYVYNVNVSYQDGALFKSYDTIKKLYVTIE